MKKQIDLTGGLVARIIIDAVFNSRNSRITLNYIWACHTCGPSRIAFGRIEDARAAGCTHRLHPYGADTRKGLRELKLEPVECNH